MGRVLTPEEHLYIRVNAVQIQITFIYFTSEHKYLNSLLLTFSKQACNFSFNAFEGKYELFLFGLTAHRLPNRLMLTYQSTSRLAEV